MGLRIAGYEGTTQAAARPFMGRSFGPVVSAKLCGDGQTDLVDLLSMPRLHIASIPTDWADWAREYGVALPANGRDLSYGRSFHMVEAALNGLGVGIADQVYVAPEIAAGRLVAPLGFVSSPRDYLFMRAADCRSKSADLFERWLIAAGAQERPQSI